MPPKLFIVLLGGTTKGCHIDDCIAIEKCGDFFVRLTPGGTAQRLKPDWFGYKIIG